MIKTFSFAWLNPRRAEVLDDRLPGRRRKRRMNQIRLRSSPLGGVRDGSGGAEDLRKAGAAPTASLKGMSPWESRSARRVHLEYAGGYAFSVPPPPPPPPPQGMRTPRTSGHAFTYKHTHIMYTITRLLLAYPLRRRAFSHSRALDTCVESFIEESDRCSGPWSVRYRAICEPFCDSIKYTEWSSEPRSRSHKLAQDTVLNKLSIACIFRNQ